MRKYIGEYRVLCERDIYGEPLTDAFTYLVGVNQSYSNSMIYRYNEDKLKIIHFGKLHSILSNFKKLGIEPLEILDCTGECSVVFYEKDLGLVDKFMKIKTIGKNTKPESLKNHPNHEQIKNEKFNNLSEEEKQRKILQGKRLLEIKKQKKND